MISFMADVIGIRDDMYIGKGYTYMKSVSEAVQEGYRDGVLEQRPTLVNLQCDIDHPTQCMADMLHVINYFESQGKEGRYDMGLLSIIWKAAFRSSGRHRTLHTLRNGRRSCASGGI